MIRRILLGVAFFSLIGGASAVAQMKPIPQAKTPISINANELQFASIDAKSNEIGIVTDVDPTFPVANAKYEVAVEDLDNDGNKDLVARVISKQTCSADLARCRTVALRYHDKIWTKVFDRSVETLEMNGIGFGGMRGLVVDHGLETWTFRPDGYRLDLSKTGKTVSFKEAPGNTIQLLAAQFGTAAQTLLAKPKMRVVFKVAPVPLADGGKPDIIVIMEGNGICGRVFGCPFRILRITGNSYVKLLSGMGTETISVLPVNRDKMHDIVAETPTGDFVYGWAGSNYGLAEAIQNGARK